MFRMVAPSDRNEIRVMFVWIFVIETVSTAVVPCLVKGLLCLYFWSVIFKIREDGWRGLHEELV